MDNNKNTLNAVPGLPWGTGLRVGSGLTGLIFGLVMVFLVLYYITFDPAQKQMWLILMILMIFVGIVAVAALATRRRKSYRSYRRGYGTRERVVERKVVVKHCVKCGEVIPEKASFCEKCGEKQPTSRTKKLKKCVKCDKDIAQVAQFCEYCGAKQST